MLFVDTQEHRRDIGRRIKQARESLGISQGVLARWLNVSTSAISNYELGRRPILSEHLVELARLLRVSVSYLAGDEGGEAWVDEEAARYYNGVPPNLKPTAKALLRELARTDDAEE